MLGPDHPTRVFPGVNEIRVPELRRLVVDLWSYVSERNPLWSDLERIPLHPTLPIERHGNLVRHIRAMVRVSEALVPVYRELWQHDLDLDAFRAASYVHDAAKVIDGRYRRDDEPR